MVVEEDGEIDVIISKKLIERERKKLEELKRIQSEKQKIVGVGKATKEETKAAKQADKDVKKLEKKIKTLEKNLEKQKRDQDSKIKNAFSKAGSFASNPKAFVENAVSELLQSSRAIPILGAALAFGGVLFKLIEKEFGDGGIFDLRVRVKDIVRSIVGLKNLMDIDAGEVFMSPDTRITTMPPETSNTESLRDGHVRFNQLTLGYR